MAAAMCEAPLKFHSDFFFQKSLFISVSSDFYEKFCVSTHISYCSLENCKFHKLLIDSAFDQNLQQIVKFLFHTILLIVHTLCSNTDFL